MRVTGDTEGSRVLAMVGDVVETLTPPSCGEGGGCGTGGPEKARRDGGRDCIGDDGAETSIGGAPGVVTMRARGADDAPPRPVDFVEFARPRLDPVEFVRPRLEEWLPLLSGGGGTGSDSRCEVAKNASVFELELHAGETAPSPCGVAAKMSRSRAVRLLNLGLLESAEGEVENAAAWDLCGGEVGIPNSCCLGDDERVF